MDQPGPSRSKRKNTDPLQGHEESKHLAEDKSSETDKTDEQVFDEVSGIKYPYACLELFNNMCAFCETHTSTV